MRSQAAAHQDAAPAGLERLFRARPVGLVGATDRSVWSTAAFANFGRLGFSGRVQR